METRGFEKAGHAHGIPPEVQLASYVVSQAQSTQSRAVEYMGGGVGLRSVVTVGAVGGGAVGVESVLVGSQAQVMAAAHSGQANSEASGKCCLCAVNGRWGSVQDVIWWECVYRVGGHGVVYVFV